MNPSDLRFREAVDKFVTRVRQDVDTHLQTLASDLLKAAESRDVHGAPDVKRAALEVARAVAKGGGQARHDLINRLADAIRSLDDATSLRATLDALARGASAEAFRVAVLVVDDEVLRPWGAFGFSAGQGPIDLPVSASPLLNACVKLRQVNHVAPSGDRPDPTLPAFMRISSGHVGLVLPLVVEDHVVALVYADGPDRPADGANGTVWTEQVEILVRHAAARLENLTSRRAVAVLNG